MSDNILKIGSRYDETGNHWLEDEKGRDGLEVEHSHSAVFVSVGDRMDNCCIDLTIEEARQMATWILQKTGGAAEHVPVGAKLCTECGDHNLVNFRTIMHPLFDKPGYRHCSGCGHDMAWHLEEGQPALLGSHRATNKTVKSDV